MRRREFITLLGAAVALPCPTRAQQAGKLPIIGFLGSSDASTQTQWLAAFTQRLGEIGWIDGRTAKIDVRWAEGRNDRSAEIAAEFVALKVDTSLQPERRQLPLRNKRHLISQSYLSPLRIRSAMALSLILHDQAAILPALRIW